LREHGMSPHLVARELLLDTAELNSLLFGLVVTALPGDRQTTAGKATLKLIRQ
jgi:hypothetical protein